MIGTTVPKLWFARLRQDWTRLDTNRHPAAHSTRREALDLAVLALLGLGLVISAFLTPHLHSIAARAPLFTLLEAIQFGFFIAAAIWVIRRRPATRYALPLIVLIALAARLVMVTGGPAASSDLYRYVWDARVQTHGINPYRYAPQDQALVGLRDAAIYPSINRKPVHTIYPPVAQFSFLAIYVIHPDSIDWLRSALSLVDTGVIGLIALALARLGERPERVILYAWHPLAIFEIGSSGHIDVVAVALLLVALHGRLSRRPIVTGIGLAAATLVKYYAVAAAPALLTGNWRRDLKFAGGFLATSVLAYIPYLSVGWGVVGFLPGYVKEEGIASGGRFYLLEQVEHLGNWLGWHLPSALINHGISDVHLFDLLLVATMGGMAVWIWRRSERFPRDVPRRALALYLTLLVLSTPTYPWYALLALVLLPFAGKRLLLATLFASGTSLLLYLQWWWRGSPQWPLAVVYGGSALILTAVSIWFGLSAIRWKRLFTALPKRVALSSSQEA